MNVDAASDVADPNSGCDTRRATASSGNDTHRTNTRRQEATSVPQGGSAYGGGRPLGGPRVGSLFSGIGGFDLGLERAGFTTSWFCEADEYCQKVLAKHWPEVPCYPDVRSLRGDSVEPVEVLCGGFPCQDISSAGKGEGITGARSGLWSEFARLIAELRPRYVLVENVPPLRTRGLEKVLADLVACGYDAEWDGIPARAVGAPHLRDRFWLVAYPSSTGRREDAGGAPPNEGEAEGRDPSRDHLASTASEGGVPAGQGPQHVGAAVADSARDAEARSAPETGTERQRTRACCESSGTGAHVADANDGVGQPGTRPRRSEGRPESGDGCERSGAGTLGHADCASPDPHAAAGSPRQAAGESGWWATEPDVGRVAHGVPARVDRLAALGNALVPQIAEWLGHRIMDYERNQHGDC